MRRVATVINTINQNRFVRVNFSSCLRAFRFGESTCHVVAAAVHSIEMAHYACLQGNFREALRARERTWYAAVKTTGCFEARQKQSEIGPIFTKTGSGRQSTVKRGKNEAFSIDLNGTRTGCLDGTSD